MSNPSFKPSDVVLRDPVPLCDTFGRTELEVAAAYLLLGMAHRDDTWSPVTLMEVSDAVRAASVVEREKRPGFWIRNRFLKPSFIDLEAEGFSKAVPVDGSVQQFSIEFTESGYEALAKWVRKASR